MWCKNQLRWVNHKSLILTLKITYQTLWPKWPPVVNAVDWLVTSFMTSMMTILSNEARPANPDRLILRGLKKSAHSYPTYLLMPYILTDRKEYTKDTFGSASQDFCALGRSCFGYSVFSGVMLASLMHSPESLFPDLQQLSLALDVNTT